MPRLWGPDFPIPNTCPACFETFNVGRCFNWSLACVPFFLCGVVFSPLDPLRILKSETIVSSLQTLVCTRPWFRRYLVKKTYNFCNLACYTACYSVMVSSSAVQQLQLKDMMSRGITNKYGISTDLKSVFVSVLQEKVTHHQVMYLYLWPSLEHHMQRSSNTERKFRKRLQAVSVSRKQ